MIQYSVKAKNQKRPKIETIFYIIKKYENQTHDRKMQEINIIVGLNLISLNFQKS